MYSTPLTPDPTGSLSCIVIDGLDLCLKAEDGPGTVVVNPGFTARAAYLRFTDTIFDGIVFRNGLPNGQPPLGVSGGAIFADSADVTALDCRFEGNNALRGGAVFELASTSMFRFCEFFENSANQLGGAFVAALDSRAAFIRCRFIANTAQDGGALVATDFSVVRDEGGVYENNVASNSGGGVRVEDSSTVWLCNTRLNGNTAPPGMGAEGFIDPTSDCDLSCCLANPGQWVGGPTFDTNPVCPDLNVSTATTRATIPAIVLTIPNCTGERLDNCTCMGLDATIEVEMISCTGVVIPGIPRDFFWLRSTMGGLVTCEPCCARVNRFPVADFPTNASGRTEFADVVCGGGCTDPLGGERLVVQSAWGPLQAPMDIQFNSPDMNGDLVVDLIDVGIFSVAFFSPTYDYCADFCADGVINLIEVGIIASAVGAQCPGICP
jgi:hypothetical protein